MINGNLPKKILYEKNSLTNIIDQANLNMKEAQFKIHRLLDTSEFHTKLNYGPPTIVKLDPGIPHCFKVDLTDQIIPIKIHFKY